VPAYNIPDLKAELKFSGPVLADIYLGRITKWNDQAIVKLIRASASPPATSPSCTDQRIGHHVYLAELPVQGVARISKRKWV